MFQKRDARGSDRRKGRKRVAYIRILDRNIKILKEINIHIHESQWISSKYNLKTTWRHILIKLSKVNNKEMEFTASRG